MPQADADRLRQPTGTDTAPLQELCLWQTPGKREGTSAIIRLINDGIADGRRQIAIGAAMARLHSAGLAPDSIRLFRFVPTILIGLNQAMGHEVHVARCKAEGVGLARRLTGGGAVFLDEGQVCWEIICRRRTLNGASLADYTALIAAAVARGIAGRFGVDARFRAPGDIEVGGRKLCGTAGATWGETVHAQGTMLVTFDSERMQRLINVPSAAARDAASRMVALHDLLGDAPAMQAVEDAIVMGLTQNLGLVAASGSRTFREEALAAKILAEEVGTDAFVLGPDRGDPEQVLVGEVSGDEGAVRAYVRLEGCGSGRRIREIVFAGKFSIRPERAIYDLEACMRGMRPVEALDAVSLYFSRTSLAGGTSMLTAFRQALAAALALDDASRRAPG